MTSERPATADGATALESLHVVLPMRTVSGGKARLGGVLDAEEREELVLGMLAHTLEVLARWPTGRCVHLVSPDPMMASVARRARTELVVQARPDDGLNGGIRLGVEAARAAGAASVLVLPGDLPHLTLEALDRLVLAADAGMAAAGGGPLLAIAPSDARSGTNALLLLPPDVISPAFGPRSFEAHLRAAEAAEAAVQVVDDPDLGFDLDTPDDLERLEPARLRELMALGRRAADGVGV